MHMFHAHVFCDVLLSQTAADVAHLNKIIMWSNSCALVGIVTMGLDHSFLVRMVAVIALSTWTFSRWTMIAHHTCHGGYDRCHPNKARWSRFKFAIGGLWNRLNDWFDWMMPEAWNIEHNHRHHYCLSELDDPDLVENNLKDVRELDAPYWVKYLIVAANVVTWKWAYYAPNTYKELKLAGMRRKNIKIPTDVDPTDAVTIKVLLAGHSSFFTLGEFFTIVAGPYLLIHFFIMPLFLIGVAYHLGHANIYGMYWTGVKNLFLAELLTNTHAFVAVVTNHAGDDLYRFRYGCKPNSGSFLLRQVLASVNFAYGTDLVDFSQGFLNYQIEHHCWPDLSMRSYQKCAPEARAICKKYGVPYVKQNVFIRVMKTIDIMIGKSSMHWFPESVELELLKMDDEMAKMQNDEKRRAREAKTKLL